MLRYFWLVFSSMASGCSAKNLHDRLDMLSFEKFGGTLFSNPTQVSTKDILFDGSPLSGAPVIIEGHAAEVDKHRTYLIIQDNFGRLLVVLTNVSNSPLVGKGLSGSMRIRILGSIDHGKKGLPFLIARSLTTQVP